MLSPSEFHKGGHAQDADDYIIYRQSKGEIYYDADGKGGADAILFAKVDKGTVLGAHDFLVI